MKPCDFVPMPSVFSVSLWSNFQIHLLHAFLPSFFSMRKAGRQEKAPHTEPPLHLFLFIRVFRVFRVFRGSNPSCLPAFLIFNEEGRKTGKKDPQRESPTAVRRPNPSFFLSFLFSVVKSPNPPSSSAHIRGYSFSSADFRLSDVDKAPPPATLPPKRCLPTISNPLSPIRKSCAAPRGSSSRS